MFEQWIHYAHIMHLNFVYWGSCDFLLPSESVAVIGRTFPTNPSLPIVMDNVQCTGIETSLGNCIYLASNELRMCSHDKDAGVRCPSGKTLVLYRVH